MLTEQELNSAEQLIRIGAKAISGDKSLEESQQITGTALHLIKRLREVSTPEPAVSETASE